MTHPGKAFNVILARTATLAVLATASCCMPALAEGWQHMGAVQRVEKLQDGIELSSGRAKMRITAFRDGVIRVRVAPQGTFPKDRSWGAIERPESGLVNIAHAKDDV